MIATSLSRKVQQVYKGGYNLLLARNSLNQTSEIPKEYIYIYIMSIYYGYINILCIYINIMSIYILCIYIYYVYIYIYIYIVY